VDKKNNGRFWDLVPETVKTVTSSVEKLLVAEYGAMFIAVGVAPPPSVIFDDETTVRNFQSAVDHNSARLGEFEMTLQSAAIKALLSAVAEAEQCQLTITPRGAESAARSYAETVSLWASRVEPGLEHWCREGRISIDDADRIRSLPPSEQVPEILLLEEDEIFFAKDLSKSIIYSVAPPGTSQHLSMIAFDVAEFEQPEIRAILARQRWFQTVTSDLPHFTYLGIEESELSDHGLKRIENAGRHFWVPDI